MTGLHKTSLAAKIRALDAEGVRSAEIARRLECSRSYISQVLNMPKPACAASLTSTQVNRPAPRSRAASPDTCQRPDARKGFAPCGEPKKRTRCGEKLGVCAYHFETTKPTGGMKL